MGTSLSLKDMLKEYFKATPFEWTTVDHPWRWVKVHGFPKVTIREVEGVFAELVRERWLVQSQTGSLFAYLERFKRLK